MQFCFYETFIPQESFCCNLQSHTIIENARLKLLTVANATPAMLLHCARLTATVGQACLTAQPGRLSNTVTPLKPVCRQAGFRDETPLRI